MVFDNIIINNAKDGILKEKGISIEDAIDMALLVGMKWGMENLLAACEASNAQGLFSIDSVRFIVKYSTEILDRELKGDF